MQPREIVAGRVAWKVDPEPAILGGQAAIHFGVGPDGESVAVKVALEPGEAGAWLDDERRLLGQVAAVPALRDRVARVLDHGVWGARRWYAMPRYPNTLATWIASGPPLSERLGAALAVLEAVALLHAAGGSDARFVHRDVKPTNVFRTAAGGWLLADFGAARAVATGTLTQTAFHSRGFAPPEQSLPIPQPPQPSWDVFAVAATTYFCAVGRPASAPGANGLSLTTLGRRAVAGLDVGPATPGDLLAYRRMLALDPSDRADLTAVVGPGLARAIEGLLAPDPRQRRGDLGTLAAAIRAEIAHPGAGRERRSWRVAGAFAAVAVGLGVAATLTGRHGPAASTCPEGLSVDGAGCRSANGVRFERIPGGWPAEGAAAPFAPFLLASDEVSQGTFAAVTGANPTASGRFATWGSLHEACPGGEAVVGDGLPVVCLSIADVAAFLGAWSAHDGLTPAYAVRGDGVVPVPGADGYRLPTEAEWRYAVAVGGPGLVDLRGDVAEAVERTDGAFGWIGGAAGDVAARLPFGHLGPDVGFRVVRDLPGPALIPHRRVGDLWVGQTEVTRAQWRAGGGDPGPRADTRHNAPCAAGADDEPMVCISWREAVTFANARSAADGLTPAYVIDGDRVAWDRAADGWRLPTTAEWRALAGPTRFPGTDDRAAWCRYGNVPVEAGCDDGFVGLAPVARFAPTPGPVFDLLGNASEWAWDAVEDNRRVVGGSFGPAVGVDADPDVAVRLASEAWFALPEDARAATVGLRLVRDAR